ncbi:hypothetical protein SAMN05421503_1464 [Terribacillus aidingensis]|uniref:Uncharacterized protein n=1 Tax=Terribacillus aidingensis TaxID=586416 RepID=A0A285NKI5_9BACI|nr:hypothetical protein SAMN05421503_1464 [Terribacillus aidingensis]
MTRGNPFKQRRYLREQKGCPCPVTPCESLECEEPRDDFESENPHFWQNPDPLGVNLNFYFVNELSGFEPCTELPGYDRPCFQR